MGVVQNSIGLRWERILQERYPVLQSTAGDENVPDFYHPSGFWIEAKAGNVLWGGRIKEYQLAQIKGFQEPVVYAFGMHNLHDAIRRLNQRTELGRQRYLEKHMDIVETYFISSRIMHQVFNMEKRTSKKGLVYCMVKPSLIRNIILDRSFTRMGESIQSAEEYYGFNRGEYSIGMNNGVGYVLYADSERKVISLV
ncbi:hypothetical protein J4218_03140 [Candidatus Pacearchaeota archaeon]|nr:hypothetical protein [Candidatus Pacearchaeota archaeon]